MAVNKNGTTNLDEELQKAAGRVVSHMNNDHASSILAYAHAFGGDGCASAVSAKMIGLDREGFLVEVTLANGERKDVLIKYDREMKSAGQLHRDEGSLSTCTSRHTASSAVRDNIFQKLQPNYRAQPCPGTLCVNYTQVSCLQRCWLSA